MRDPESQRADRDQHRDDELAVALQAAFVPATNNGARFALVPVLAVVAWGVAGLIVAVRRFSRVPRRG